MGYSCTAMASFVIDAIMAAVRHENSGNTYKGKDGQLYFWERGRENSDGAMTGVIQRMLPNDYCRRVASFRIEPNGRITRFYGLTKAVKERAERTARLHYIETFKHEPN